MKKFPSGKRPLDQGYEVETSDPYNINIIANPRAIRETITSVKQHCQEKRNGTGCNNVEVCIIPVSTPGCVKCGERQVKVTYYLADPPFTADEPLEAAPYCITYYF